MIRNKGIRYGVGSLLPGLVFGFLVASRTANGTSAESQRTEIGESAFAADSLKLSPSKKSTHAVRHPLDDLMDILVLNGSGRIAVDDLAALGFLPAHGGGLWAGQEDKPVEQTHKNIQVLKGLPDSQLFMVMNFMRASLGVSCAYCHVYGGDDKWEWEKDDKPEKRTARRMIQMVFDINKANFNGEKRVTCYTCHKGKTELGALPPLPQAAPEGGAGGSADEKTASSSLPSVDQVLNRYVEALGGKAAYEKLKTRVMKGSQIKFDGTALPLEIYQASPNKYISMVKVPNGMIYMGFNGTAGWMKNPRVQRDLSGGQLAQLKRTAEFYGDLNLKGLYPNMTLVGKERINEREAYVIRSPVGDKRIEKLYFDTQTGLLIRILGLDETLIGAIPDQLDFSDYREVDGVKLPFTVQVSYVDPWVGWTRKFTEIKHNVPIDDAKFNAPGK